MEHAHHHHHHHHVEPLNSLNKLYFIAIALNFGYVILEVIVGLTSNSLGLISDAGHKLIDCLTLVVAIIAFALTKSKPTKKYSYGLRKSSVIISMFNTIALLVVIAFIIIESIERFASNEVVDGSAISWTAAVGIIVSGVSALLLLKHQKRDINTRGAFLHMATDAVASLGVVASGIIISKTGWYFIDPIISLGIAAMLLYNTIRLLAESIRMSIDAVPDSICYDAVKDAIASSAGVQEIRKLRIWPVSIDETALTAHISLSPDSAPQSQVVAAIRERLQSEFKINEITIEAQ